MLVQFYALMGFIRIQYACAVQLYSTNHAYCMRIQYSTCAQYACAAYKAHVVRMLYITVQLYIYNCTLIQHKSHARATCIPLPQPQLKIATAAVLPRSPPCGHCHHACNTSDSSGLAGFAWPLHALPSTQHPHSSACTPPSRPRTLTRARAVAALVPSLRMRSTLM